MLLNDGSVHTIVTIKIDDKYGGDRSLAAQVWNNYAEPCKLCTVTWRTGKEVMIASLNVTKKAEQMRVSAQARTHLRQVQDRGSAQ